MRRFPVRLAVPSALLALALAPAACSSGGDESQATGGGAGATAAEAAPPPAADTGAGRSVPAVAAARVLPDGTLIRTAELTVVVDDVAAAADEAADVAARAAGVVQAEERSGTGPDRSAVVVLRVPPSAFDDVLGRLAALGREQERHVDTQDVTEQLVDLDSRVATQAASVARVRALLDRAQDVGDVVDIEGELTERTAALESLQARRAALRDRVDLSTVTLRLHSDDGPLAASGPDGFRDGLAVGWAALVSAGRALAVAAGVLLPFTPLLLVGGLVLHRTRSRRAVSP